MASIKCKRFERPSAEYFAYGAGAYWWEERSGSPGLMLLVPGSYAPEWIRCVEGDVGVGRGGKDEVGWWHTWNGDREEPTVRASIGGRTWHGWLTDGWLSGGLG